MKILFSGDWHADRMTAGYDRFDDIRKAVWQPTNAAISNNVDLYVFLGDLANPNNVRSHRSVAMAIEVADTLARDSIPSIWINGNHDVIEDGTVDLNGRCYSSLSALGAKWALYSEPDLLRYEIPIVVLPFPSSHGMYDPIDVIEEYGKGELKDADRVVVIGHLSLSGAKMGSESADMARGKTIEWPVAAIKEYWPNAVMVGGHYHRQQTCNGVMFPGSLARLGFDEETNEPGYLILEV